MYHTSNLRSLTFHFAQLESFMLEDHIDPDLLFKPDEVEERKLFLLVQLPRGLCFACGRCSATCDMNLDDWSYTHRFTMIPVFAPSGKYGPTLFVFKGDKIHYLTVSGRKSTYTECPTDRLPRCSVI